MTDFARKFISTKKGKVLTAIGAFILLVVTCSVVSQPEMTKEEMLQGLREQSEREAKHPDSPVAHCFNQYPEGAQRTECVNAYWDSLWMHPNLADAQMAFKECNNKLNQRNPETAAYPDNRGITRAVMIGGWDDDMPSKEEVDKKVDEQIRGWNQFNPGLNCRLSGDNSSSQTVEAEQTESTEIASCPTPTEAVYLDAVAVEVRVIGIAMLEAEQLLNQLSVNPALYENSAWRSAYTTNFKRAQSSAKVLLAIEAPETAFQIDSVLKSTAHYVDGTARESLIALEADSAQDFERSLGIAESYALDAAEGMFALKLAKDNFC